MERTVRFYSEAVPMAGVLFLPDNLARAERRPGIVLCHGFTAVKEVLLPEVARRLAKLGYVALTFDYRFLGESGGEPRRQIIPLRQIEDIHNAVTFLQCQPEVNPERLGLLGVSLGGANVSYAAGVEERVKATVSVCGIGDCGRWIRDACHFWEWKALLQRLAEDRRERVLSGRLQYVQAKDIVPEPESTTKLFGEILRQYPQWSREITLASGEALIAYRPESVVQHISPRAIMWLHGDADERVSMEESLSMYKKAGEPKKLVVLPGLGHSDIIAGPGLEQSMPYITEWFATYL
ncbi:MAG: alpha/beta hydrolase [Deltaproteobacteria bacterium]|nr:alpha/beta hydrolase [Deltaproteobacteria bacterium]